MNDPIRDYLYLDIDRVRSIYAQASGGLTESIRELQQEFNAHGEEQEQKSELISKSLMLGSGRVATRVFHDYLFTAMEKHLGNKVIEISKHTASSVCPGVLFRITGKPEIDDYERMQELMENYNEMFKYILAVGLSKTIQEETWDIQDELRKLSSSQRTGNSNNSKKRQKELEQRLEQLAPESIASEILAAERKGISPLISVAFGQVYGLLYKDVFEVKIVPDFKENTVFRGILNKQYLREDPTIIYAKYGTRPKVNLTMVGQITTVLDPRDIPQTTGADDGQGQEVNPNSSEGSNLRDAMENMYKSIADIEEHIVGPGARTTFVATPLAIYHEVN